MLCVALVPSFYIEWLSRDLVITYTLAIAMQVFFSCGCSQHADPTILGTHVSVDTYPGVELLGCGVCVSHLTLMSETEYPGLPSCSMGDSVLGSLHSGPCCRNVH